MLLTQSGKKSIEKLTGQIVDKDVRSGRSTRLAFEIIARCYNMPGQWVQVNDHDVNTNVELAGKISDILHTLNFKFFEIDRRENEQVCIRLLSLEERAN